jgi:8-oxo-dGTP diphosphatase
MAKKGKGHKNRESEAGREPKDVDAGMSRSSGEAEFLAEYDAAEFSHPSLTVDVVLLTATSDALQALLVRRERHPESGKWALPGGFVRLDESLDAAAARVLRDKAGLSGVFLEQLYTFGAVSRDPRTRVITVSYYALVANDRLAAAIASRERPAAGGASGASGGERTRLARLLVPWSGERGGPVEAFDADGAGMPLAFDHSEILGMAVKRLRGKLDYAPIGFELLPEVFSLRELQQIHEVISGRRTNKDSFRRRMLASGQLEATGERNTEVANRPPERYRFRGVEG